MRSCLRSLLKYPARNIVYAVVLTSAFTALGFFTSAVMTVTGAPSYVRGLSGASSLVPPIITVGAFCLFALPFIHYVFISERGYEIGVLRALGLSKGGVFARLMLENVIIVVTCLAVSLIVLSVVYNGLIRAFLPIDGIEAALVGIEGNDGGLRDFLRFEPAAFGVTSVAAFVTSAFALLTTNAIVTRNEPMKIMSKQR